MEVVSGVGAEIIQFSCWNEATFYMMLSKPADLEKNQGLQVFLFVFVDLCKTK